MFLCIIYDYNRRRVLHSIASRKHCELLMLIFHQKTVMAYTIYTMRIPDALVLQIVSSSRKLSEEQISNLRAQEKELHKSMQELVIRADLITENELTKLYARMLDVPFVDLDLVPIDLQLLQIIPERVARMKSVVIFSRNKDGSYNAAFSDKPSQKTLDLIEKYVKKPVHVHLGPKPSIERWLNQYRVIDSRIGPLIRVKRGSRETRREATGLELAQELLAQAIKLTASDIHIEPREHSAHIRLRIDGRLQGFHPLSLMQYDSLKAYLMQDLANLTTAQSSAPSEGIFVHTVGERKFKISMAVIPVLDGQKISLRIQELGTKVQELQELGLWGPSLTRVEHALSNANGLIIVVGSGKSGKTTTLHALINKKQGTHISIIAIEETAAYSEPYMTHVMVNPKYGATYAKCLSAALQHDPDVLLVQRIQDIPTTKKTIEASEHRQLICGGLIAASASDSVDKLRSLTIPSHDIANVLKCVIAQRLVRKLCQNCKVQVPVNETIADMVGAVMQRTPYYSMKDIHLIEKAAASEGVGDPSIIMSDTKKIKSIWMNNPDGCDHCHDTGYAGQTGIFEVMKMTKDLDRLIVEEKDKDKLQETAITEGMIPMSIDGLIKVLRGITSIDELVRVLPTVY
jgi:type IV pilus assembly protein PilB